LTPFATAGARQSPNLWSSSGLTSASGRLETTKIFALSGRSQRSLNAVRSARLSAAIALGSAPGGPP
jgi:hypothetical protein